MASKMIVAMGSIASLVLGMLGTGMIVFGIGCAGSDLKELLLHLVMPGLPGLYLIFMAALILRFLVGPHLEEPEEPSDGGQQ